MSIVAFQATYPSINYIFRNGKPAIFVAGKFVTDVQKEIDELREEIAAGQPHIRECTPEEIKVAGVPGGDLMTGLKEKFFQEFLADQKKAAMQQAEAAIKGSEYEQGEVKPASSSDIANAAAGGSGADLAAQLSKMLLVGIQPEHVVSPIGAPMSTEAALAALASTPKE